MARVLLVVLCCGWWSISVVAAENTYGVMSVGYAGAQSFENESRGLSYKLAMAYQIDRQWYGEFGFQQLADGQASSGIQNINEINQVEDTLVGSALYFALLGKAAGQSGELFYRLGLLKTDIQGASVQINEPECAIGTGRVLAGESEQSYTLCEYDESGIAAAIGLGFDFYIGTRTMLRTEIEYIKGQDDLSFAAATFGVRYNF